MKKYHLEIKLVTTVVLVLTLLGIIVFRKGVREDFIVFNQHLDEVAVTIDDKEYLLSDIAFYVYYEESFVEKQAMEYNSENPDKYWELHINGEFVDVLARDTAMEMFVHDTILYELAIAQGIELTDEDKEYVYSAAKDYYCFMDDEQKAALGVDEENFMEVLTRKAYGEKYSETVAYEAGMDVSRMDVGGVLYEEIHTEHEVKVKDIWKKVEFGNITVVH